MALTSIFFTSKKDLKMRRAYKNRVVEPLPSARLISKSETPLNEHQRNAIGTRPEVREYCSEFSSINVSPFYVIALGSCHYLIHFVVRCRLKQNPSSPASPPSSSSPAYPTAPLAGLDDSLADCSQSIARDQRRHPPSSSSPSSPAPGSPS